MAQSKAPPAAHCPEPAALLDVSTVARLLSCSPRHVYRLAECRQIPQPVKLGALIRWRRSELEEWLEAGCPYSDGKERRR